MLTYTLLLDVPYLTTQGFGSQFGGLQYIPEGRLGSPSGKWLLTEKRKEEGSYLCCLCSAYPPQTSLILILDNSQGDVGTSIQDASFLDIPSWSQLKVCHPSHFTRTQADNWDLLLYYYFMKKISPAKCGHWKSKLKGSHCLALHQELGKVSEEKKPTKVFDPM